MPVKVWYTSSTLWFNAAVVLLFIIDYLVAHSELYGPWQGYASLINNWLVLIAGVVNVIMRLRTHQPIANSPGAAMAAKKRAKIQHPSGGL